MLYDTTSNVRSGNLLEDELIEQLTLALKIDSSAEIDRLIFEDVETLAMTATKVFGRPVRYLGANDVGEHVFNVA
jgi:hypothetical protein